MTALYYDTAIAAERGERHELWPDVDRDHPDEEPHPTWAEIKADEAKDPRHPRPLDARTRSWIAAVFAEALYDGPIAPPDPGGMDAYWETVKAWREQGITARSQVT